MPFRNYVVFYFLVKELDFAFIPVEFRFDKISSPFQPKSKYIDSLVQQLANYGLYAHCLLLPINFIGTQSHAFIYGIRIAALTSQWQS